MAIDSTTVLLATVAITTAAWVITAFVTKPTAREKLLSFYRLVRPAGPGWGTIPAEAGAGPSHDSLAQAGLGWVLGCVFIYSALFGTGSLLYGRVSIALFWIAGFLVSGFGLLKLVPSMWAGETDRAD
jgi:hypothetical protein